ncbi:hypothetical protein [Aliarcobacter butzleri]|uniref:hypothetical protein n=1 Tax=Aliarcobacter butzleri TaxID=28197 RepID=UPI003AF91336
MSKNKELLRKTNQNQIRLTVLEKQVLRYTEFLSSIRGSRKESKIKLNPDFIEALEKEKEEFQSKINEEKPLFISNKIEKLKDFNSKIKNKVTDSKNSKVIKDELFKNLEQEIAQFEAMIEQLKQENRLLKKELELIIEKEQKLAQKNSLEKENSTLKEKIESIKNKDKTPFDEDIKEKKPLKVNKITYGHNQEQER